MLGRSQGRLGPRRTGCVTGEPGQGGGKEGGEAAEDLRGGGEEKRDPPFVK